MVHIAVRELVQPFNILWTTPFGEERRLKFKGHSIPDLYTSFTSSFNLQFNGKTERF